MEKLTAAEFKTIAQNIVGDAEGWEERIGAEMNTNPNTIKKCMEKDKFSHGLCDLLRTAAGMERSYDRFNPTAEETRAHYSRQKFLRSKGVYSSI